MEDIIFNDGFNDDWRTAENNDGIILNIKEFVGCKDANREWNSPEKAKALFLHTYSYESFIYPESLILLGRTGTGKSAIMCRLQEYVNSGKARDYSFAITISYDDILTEISEMISDYQSINISAELKRLMKIFFHTRTMLYIASTSRFETKDIKNIKSYLSRNGISIENNVGMSSLISRTLRAIKAAGALSGKVGEVAREIDKITNVIGEFVERGYDEALDEMKRVLSNDNVLILVDSTDEYDLKDIKVLRCAKALIATCFDFYNNTEKDHVFIKISLPSEIYTMLVDQLPGKQQGNTVVIQWSSKELIRMIAIRLLESSIHNRFGQKLLRFSNRYEFGDFQEANPKSYDKACELLFEILPNECPTSTNLSYHTIHYLIRHTLKKPREMMDVFDYLLTKMYDENVNMNYFKQFPDDIRKIVHSTQELMINSALSMYSTTYQNIPDDCYEILHGLKFVFKGRDLKDRLKAAQAVLEREGYGGVYDQEDIKRILLESGLVGTLNRDSLVFIDSDSDDKSRSHTLENSYRIIVALFEYQVKGRLRLNDDSYYVVHPMCYEHFECKVLNQTLVIPERIDNEEVMNVRIRKVLEGS